MRPSTEVLVPLDRLFQLPHPQCVSESSEKQAVMGGIYLHVERDGTAKVMLEVEGNITAMPFWVVRYFFYEVAGTYYGRNITCFTIPSTRTPYSAMGILSFAFYLHIDDRNTSHRVLAPGCAVCICGPPIEAYPCQSRSQRR